MVEATNSTNECAADRRRRPQVSITLPSTSCAVLKMHLLTLENCRPALGTYGFTAWNVSLTPNLDKFAVGRYLRCPNVYKK